MPISVKLSTAEHRAWRVNKAQWVSPEGVVLRAVTPEEEKALFPAVERTKRMGKTQSYPLEVVYRQEDPDTGQVYEQKTQMEATVRITRTGREQGSFIADVFVNGCRYVKGREIIEKRMLATHGDCNLHGPNGKRIRVVRDPRVRRPTYSESQRSAPHPDNCHCRGWRDKGEPGRHHAACDWNAKAPSNERALPFQPQAEVQPLVDSPEPLESLAFDAATVGRPTTPYAPGRVGPLVVPPPRSAGPVRQPLEYANVPSLTTPEAPIVRTKTVQPKAVEVFPPSRCPLDCRGLKNPAAAWKWPPGRRAEKGQHHPVCEHDSAYRAEQRGSERWMIYDMARQTEIREASTDEVTRSELELQKNGTRSVNIGGTLFAVVQSGAARTAAMRRPRSRPAPVEVEREEPIVTATPGPSRQAIAEERRQALLEASQLPPVLSSRESRSAEPAVVTDEITALRARIAELERGQLLREPIGPGVARTEGPSLLSTGPVVAPPADYLRNELGLVGHQQATDDIAPGPVELVDPEPFIDPLAHRGQPPSALRPRGFVPPALPGVTGTPVPVVVVVPSEAAESEPDVEEDDSEGGDGEDDEILANGDEARVVDWTPEPSLESPVEQPGV